MIYVDSSVILAEVLSESTRPDRSFWQNELSTSRLAEYEVFVRLNAYGVSREHHHYAREVLARIALVELLTVVLERAIQPFPKPIRTLDALHLATCVYLASRSRPIKLATYDSRLSEAAGALGLEVIRPS
jgi:predicted nucleic acid-binding protein